MDRLGIEESYTDFAGKRRKVSQETCRLVREAMGIEPGETLPEPPVIVLREGETLPIPSRAEIELEDGSRIETGTTLPAGLPLGYHRLRFKGAEKLLIVAPQRCYLQRNWRTWGWSAQLYSVRSQESWGIGDLGDLERLARWSAWLGAGTLLINPLHAALPLLPQQPSPYYPSSRRYRNPLFLHIESLPGYVPQNGLSRTARVLNQQPVIDRDPIYRMKIQALEHTWREFAGDRLFERYGQEQGESLRLFATFNALTEYHGKAWQQWPEEHRHPSSSGVRRFEVEFSDRIRFHQWVQWLIDRQLAYASSHVALLQDLPVGFDPDGADAWQWQDLIAADARVGAPPDQYSEEGQDWGLPPFIPHKLAAAQYQPFIETVRATLRHSGGLRIDHVMGLFRLFWIPLGRSPREGTYVRYPADDLLAIVALESQRAKAFIVGEDLGTVEPGVRERLAAHCVLSYRLAWFEEQPPEKYPVLALAAVSTHDLPTVAGVWSGTDADADKLSEKLMRLANMQADATPGEVAIKVYERLSEAPSVVVTASLEDSLGVEERPNVPGTTTERPNWSLPLPRRLEEIERDPHVMAIAGALSKDVVRDPLRRLA